VGVLYPPSHLGYDGGHRDAVLDVLGLTAGDHAPTAGAWDRLAETVRDWRRGTAVVSHELLADATEAQVERIVSSLGDAELHVVHVAQDLGRQLPRAWQRWVHNGGTVPFATYAERVVHRDQHRMSRVFWRSHDLGDVLARWSTAVPAERVHVVTAARGQHGAEETWARFAGTLGVDRHRFRLGAAASDSASDGLVSLTGTEVVRLLNVGVEAVDPSPGSSREVLLRHSRGVAGAVPRLPEALRESVTAAAEQSLQSVELNGWQLVGRSEDLLPAADAFAARPDQVTPAVEDVLAAQTEVLRSLIGGPARRGPAGVHRRALRVLRERVRP
jgi:hypothetical protein